MAELDSDTPAALFGHCQNVWRRMSSRSTIVRAPDGDDDDDGPSNDGDMIVYEGNLTALITGELNLSVPYYSKCTRALKDMGCIKQLRRGGGASPSQWELIEEPTLETWNKYIHGENGDKVQARRRPTRADQQDQQIRALSERVDKLEQDMKTLLKGLANA
jgi:hypothetical protein